MEFPDEEENREKDFILARCPVMRTFLDPDAKVEDNNWLNNLKNTFSPLHAELLEILGKDKFEEDLESFVEIADRDEIYIDAAETRKKSFFTSIVAAIGYEIGNENEINLFFGDIYGQLVLTLNLVHNSREAADATLRLLLEGARWRETAANDVPDEFRGFRFELP